MKYQIFARYNQEDEWGEWQVGTFAIKEDARDYMNRTVERYHTQYKKPNFEMAMKSISEEKSDKFNSMLNSLID